MTMGLRKFIEFNPISITELEKDQNVLVQQLLTHIDATKSLKDEEVAKYAYRRLVCRMDGEDFELNYGTFPTSNRNSDAEEEADLTEIVKGLLHECGQPLFYTGSQQLSTNTSCRSSKVTELIYLYRDLH